MDGGSTPPGSTSGEKKEQSETRQIRKRPSHDCKIMKLGLFVLVRACPAPQRQGERDRIAGKDLPRIGGRAARMCGTYVCGLERMVRKLGFFDLRGACPVPKRQGDSEIGLREKIFREKGGEPHAYAAPKCLGLSTKF